MAENLNCCLMHRRRTLIKAVVKSIPTYTMSKIGLPKSICQELTSAIQNILVERWYKLLRSLLGEEGGDGKY